MTNIFKAEMDAAAAVQDAFASMVRHYASGVTRRTRTMDEVPQAYREAVRQYTAEVTTSAGPKQFFGKQNSERLKFYQELKAQGFVFHRASQADHDFLFSTILDTVYAGEKPQVRPVLKEYGAAQGYAAEWAEKVAIKKQPKKVSKSLARQQDHPVIKELKEGGMMSRTHQAALKDATYSGIAEMLFSGSQNIRKQKSLEARMADLEARLVAAEADAARANARLDIKDAGMDWKEMARSILAVEPGISKRELAKRLGKAHSTVIQYFRELMV